MLARKWAVLLLFVFGSACAEPEFGIDQQAAYNASQSVIGKQIGDYQLRDQTGKSVRLSDYRGKPLLVSFIYTGCFQSCPTDTLLISKAVSTVHDVLGGNAFKTASIGFNVPFDTPDAMSAFAHQRGISARNWDFLSPDRTTIESLTRDFGFVYVATPKGFDHVAQLTVVDRNGKIYRQLYGDALNAQAIMSTLRDMENGAPPVPQGWPGVMARIRLLCTIYDSSSGTYRADYSLIVGMLVGASILGSVAYLLFSEWRRSRRIV